MAAEGQERLIRIAVVGHTNAGKTSLLRTLMRDRKFGSVSIHPATTRHAEAARLDLEHGCAIAFIDTPGFEDSIGLLNWLHQRDPDPRTPGPKRLADFLNSAAAQTDFAQEAKALRQLLDCDLAYYVADASEPVSGKYRDEFVLLNWSGKAVLVVLNFVAATEHTGDWREALRHAGLHNVAEFDTVVFNPADEQRLLQQTALLLPAAEPHLQQLQSLRDEERLRQFEAAAALIAETLIACAQVHAGGAGAVDSVRGQVQDLELRLNRDLLALYRFDEADYRPDDLPIQGAQWSLDLFDARVLSDIGLSLGGSAAKGAAAGAAIDLVAGFTTLGMATLIGGAIGAGLDGANRVRRYLSARPGQAGATQAADATLCYLARRACVLIRDLARRGHAAVQPLVTGADLSTQLQGERQLLAILRQSRYQPNWAGHRTEARLFRHREELKTLIRENLPVE